MTVTVETLNVTHRVLVAVCIETLTYNSELYTNMPSLAPPLFELGHAKDFASSGRTLATAFSPRDESLAVYATNNVRNTFMSCSYNY